jgi:hypothetical protein
VLEDERRAPSKSSRGYAGERGAQPPADQHVGFLGTNSGADLARVPDEPEGSQQTVTHGGPQLAAAFGERVNGEARRLCPREQRPGRVRHHGLPLYSAREIQQDQLCTADDG